MYFLPLRIKYPSTSAVSALRIVRLSTVINSAVVRHVPSESAMEALGASIAQSTRAGDTVLLFGNIAAGKTCFARGFVRKYTGDPAMIVSSPTFLLDHVYHAACNNAPPVHHLDLYRLRGPEDLIGLDLPRVFSKDVAVIEWPDRLGDENMPASRLDVHIAGSSSGHEARCVTLQPIGEDWARRIARMQAC